MGLHCKSLPASTVIYNIEYLTILTNGSSDTGTSGTDPISRYNSAVYVAMIFIHMVIMFTFIEVANRPHVLVIVMNILLILWMKVCLSAPKYLTVSSRQIMKHVFFYGPGLFLGWSGP
jgi:hypothetical protein